MAAEDKTNANNHGNKNKKRKQRYLPYNRPVRKGSYPLHPGVQGFFLTCDGGRERQATNEAINVIDNFYEELLDGKTTGSKLPVLPNKPVNKITKFSESDSSSGDDADADDDDKPDSQKEDANHENLACTKSDIDDVPTHEKQENATSDPQKEDNANKENLASTKSDVHDVPCHEKQAITTMETPAKKQRIETVASKRGNVTCGGTEEKSIDKLIEDEIKELGDRNKRRFVSLDSGCNGVIFVQMHKRDGDPGPAEIVQHMMTSAAATRKHMSRFILRVIPVEVTCYASEEEISKAIKPLVSLHFPAEAQNPQKFAVLYEARANTGVDRMSIINSVAKSVPGPHKVDLNNPDKTIIVQIVKTVCLIGIVEKYKELAKYNLRQLTSPKP